MKHELVEFEECSLFNSSHSYSHGFSRARCSCGWISASSRKETALVALFEVHAKRADPAAEADQ